MDYTIIEFKTKPLKQTARDFLEKECNDILSPRHGTVIPKNVGRVNMRFLIFKGRTHITIEAIYDADTRKFVTLTNLNIEYNGTGNQQSSVRGIVDNEEMIEIINSELEKRLK